MVEADLTKDLQKVEKKDKVEDSSSAAAGANPEEEKKDGETSKLIKGMRELEVKNVVVNLESKNETWVTLGVPSDIEQGLANLSYFKPSIIQAKSIPFIVNNPSQNYGFQSINGSGKTGAFAIPSLMKVDPEVEKIQVIILANTRELIRQIYQVMQVISGHTKIKLLLGESSLKDFNGQILVTVPGYLKNKLTGRKALDLSQLKMIVYDEADELFIQQSNHEGFQLLKQALGKLNNKPQHILYSATYTEDVITVARKVVGDFKMFNMKKESLKLKGVKNLKMKCQDDMKDEFVMQMHTRLEKAMTMVFVNRKDSATQLQQRLKVQGIQANILMGGLENDARDKLIDDFRQGVFTTLISTNVLARGIDVPEVDIVINYDVPMIKQCGFYNPDYANFMHRVGRTGRFGTDGLALTLMGSEVDEEHVQMIAEHYSIEINEIKTFDELSKTYGEMRQDLV